MDIIYRTRMRQKGDEVLTGDYALLRPNYHLIGSLQLAWNKDSFMQLYLYNILFAH